MAQVTLIAFEGKSPRVDPTAFVAPGARLIGDIEIGPQSSIWYNAVSYTHLRARDPKTSRMPSSA